MMSMGPNLARPHIPVLTAQDLYSLPDGGVQTAVTQQFLRQIKNSHLVKTRFFPEEPAPLNPPLHAVAVDQIATALICAAIGRSTLFQFDKCVDAAKALTYLNVQLQDQKIVDCGQSLYGELFPIYAKNDNASFADYTGDGNHWARELANLATSPNFINKEMQQIFTQPNWLETLNLVFYKIDRLNPNENIHVLGTWSKAYPEKNIVNNWKQRNFIPRANLSQAPDDFVSAVNKAIMIETKDRDWEIDRRTVFGAQVWAFLLGYPKQLGFTTGERPQHRHKDD